jgi:hypothetical protein
MPKTLAFLVTCVVCAIAPGVASAATIPVGTPLGEEASVDTQQCVVTGCTLVQRALRDGSNGAIPRDGTLTAFHAIGHGPVRFKVLRLESDSYTPVAETDLVTLDGKTDYPTRLPVHAGDLIAVEIPAGVDVRENVNPMTATWVGIREGEGSSTGYFEPSPADGATSKLTGTIDGTLQLAADLEVPGATALTCVVPGLHGRSLVNARAALGKRSCAVGKVTRRSGGRGSFVVVKQGVARGERLDDGARIDLVLARRR